MLILSTGGMKQERYWVVFVVFCSALLQTLKTLLLVIWLCRSVVFLMELPLSSEVGLLKNHNF